MAAGDSSLSICSDSLLMLGASPIASFDEGSDAATIASRLYDDIKSVLLVAQPWAFTLKKVRLSRLNITPVNEWLYAYQLPSDRVAAPRAVYNTDSTNVSPTVAWEVFGDQLYSSDEEVYIDYQYDPGEDQYPKYFVQLLKYWLAWHFAEPITDQVSKAQYWQSIAVGMPSENGRGGYFRVAMNIDSQNNTSQTFVNFDLVAVRF